MEIQNNIIEGKKPASTSTLSSSFSFNNKDDDDLI